MILLTTEVAQLNMASKNVHVNNLAKIQSEITHLQTVHDGLMMAMENIQIGTNMSAEGFNIMCLTVAWVKKELEALKQKRQKIIDLI